MALSRTTLEKLIKKQRIRRRGLATRSLRRHGFFVRVAKYLGVLLALAFLALAGFVLYRFFISPYFELKKLVIAGVSDDVAGEIRALTRLEPHKGINLLFLREERILETVLKHPRIESAVVTKCYPNALMILARERKPVAIVAAGTLYLIDHDGYVLDTVVRPDRDEQRFPFITGVEREQIVLGQPIPTKAAYRALDLFDCLSEADSAVAKLVSEVRIGRDEGLTLVLSGGIEVLLGTSDFADRLPALELFYQKYRDFNSLEYVDLRFQNQIIYRPRGGQGAGNLPASGRPWLASQARGEL